MRILGIETTCDETGAAIVDDGRRIVSNVVASSSNIHEKYGGIVPEVASREQVKAMIPVLKEVLDRVDKSSIDAIAVAYGPGLIGSLLIGVETAKTLSLSLGVPFSPVNHLIGHVYANWLIENREPPKFPLIALIVSGGHTDLIFMKDHFTFKWLGGTRDDAAGEVFDKVARLLGLSYPGGPEIERVASSWSLVAGEKLIKFPRPMIQDDNFDFSFSGLKTAVVNHVSQVSNVNGQLSAIAFEFQSAIVDVLSVKAFLAAKKFNAQSIVVGGGVAANSFLKDRFSADGTHEKISTFFPDKKMSVDNGAMIASAAFFQNSFSNPLKIFANPSLHF